MWRTALRVIARPVPREVGRIPTTRGVTRDMAMQASELHPPTPLQSLRRHRARYGGLALAAAGSIGLTMLYLRIQEAEELLPAVVEEATSPERIDDVSEIFARESPHILDVVPMRCTIIAALRKQPCTLQREG